MSFIPKNIPRYEELGLNTFKLICYKHSRYKYVTTHLLYSQNRKNEIIKNYETDKLNLSDCFKRIIYP